MEKSVCCACGWHVHGSQEELIDAFAQHEGGPRKAAHTRAGSRTGQAREQPVCASPDGDRVSREDVRCNAA